MPISSHYPPIEVPDVDVWSFIFSEIQAGFPPEQEVLFDVETNERLTYGQIKDDTIKIGQGLLDFWSWNTGQVLAIAAPNCLQYATMIFSTLWAGGTVAAMNPLGTVDELTSQLKASGARAVATDASTYPKVAQAAKIAGIPASKVIVLEGNVSGKTSLALLKHHNSKSQRPQMRPNTDLAFLVFSSGTTGLPKGVMLSHGNFVANILQVAVMDQQNTTWQQDRVLGFLPMYHIYGLAVLVVQPLFRGVPVYVMRKFDFPTFCDSIQRNRITFAYVVPPVVLALANSPATSKYDFSSLRMLHSSAASLAPDLARRTHAKLKVGIKQGYGASETAPGISSQSWEDWHETPGASGRLLPSMCLKVMNDGKEVATGESGELWVSGPNIFKGYLNNPEATAASLDTEGYYHTGDIGYVDRNHNIYITDRLKELIKYNGFQVAPAEVEAVLLSHPGVRDTAVIGVYSDAKATELPKAYVVPQPGYSPGPELKDQIEAWLREKLAPYKQLRGGIEFIDEIPKSAAGKILRRILVDAARESARKSVGRAKL